ncbi:hypothetical protein [Aliikangiella sp. IMCC44359]|uniref:hypothetical protein n=1 Tax=Aliikangiella sp. IMCC44359 TaxID=3459125 RepID=UPI00403ADD2F
MKKLISLFVITMTMFNAIADSDKPVAPAEVIEEIKIECEAYAKDDQVKPEDQKSYVLICVNEELEARGYQSIESLDN